MSGPLGADSSLNASIITRILGESSDLTVRSLGVGRTQGEKDITDCQIRLVYLDGMVDNQTLQESIIPAIQNIGLVPLETDLIELFSREILPVGQVSTVDNFPHAVRTVLTGCLLLMIDGYVQGLSLSIQGYEKRSIEEPKTQAVIRGPQEAFTEDLRTNTTMIRRKMKNERLRIETHTAGQMTQTDISVMYIDGIAEQQLLDQVWKLIDHLTLKTVLEGSISKNICRVIKGLFSLLC